jgi:hypothetical protein
LAFIATGVAGVVEAEAVGFDDIAEVGVVTGGGVSVELFMSSRQGTDGDTVDGEVVAKSGAVDTCRGEAGGFNDGGACRFGDDKSGSGRGGGNGWPDVTVDVVDMVVCAEDQCGVGYRCRWTGGRNETSGKR